MKTVCIRCLFRGSVSWRYDLARIWRNRKLYGFKFDWLEKILLVPRELVFNLLLMLWNLALPGHQQPWYWHNQPVPTVDLDCLTQCALVMSHGYRTGLTLTQVSTSVDLKSVTVRFSGIYLRSVSQVKTQPSITKLCLKNTFIKLHSNLPVVNELRHQGWSQAGWEASFSVPSICRPLNSCAFNDGGFMAELWEHLEWRNMYLWSAAKFSTVMLDFGGHFVGTFWFS